MPITHVIAVRVSLSVCVCVSMCVSMRHLSHDQRAVFAGGRGGVVVLDKHGLGCFRLSITESGRAVNYRMIGAHYKHSSTLQRFTAHHVFLPELFLPLHPECGQCSLMNVTHLQHIAGH